MRVPLGFPSPAEACAVQDPGGPVDEAFERLRSRARAENGKLLHVATRVEEGMSSTSARTE
ncbi:hypothetical protein GCM10010492_59450 [Saccharothrix mutabilis subsp. mutabilis]|uniref:Uncharacterized protein n=1 Tax=Saccharothrix mutabilis subsp. mutabilis TaxID=66855 RepID=A0ABP3E373_9PSEU